MNHITIRRYLNETIYCFYNLFAYANNNPVKYYDPDGRIAVVVIGGIAIGVKAIVAASAVLCIAFIVLCYPALKTAIQEIRRSIQGFFKECKKRVLSYWEKRRKSQRLHIHHIVAKADKRAKKSQYILESVGISVSTDERNLVPLKDRFHQRLHTNAYFEAVDACLFGKNDIVQVSNTLFALKTILAIINTGA